jgi:LysM repeat protein
MKIKPIIVVIMFVAFIVIFAGGAISQTDLTPDTPPAPGTGQGLTAGAGDGGFSGDSGSANGLLAGSNALPQFSPCGLTYTVRSGDTLSKIASACNVSLSSLLSANPTIQNPNLIHPGQQLAISGSPAPSVAAAAAVPTAVPALLAQLATATPTLAAAAGAAAGAAETGAQQDPLVELAAPPSGSATLSPLKSIFNALEPTGLKPGGSVTISMRNLPPSTEVQIAIGKVGTPPTTVDQRTTGADGRLTVTVAIPLKAKPGELWLVTVTSAQPKIKVTSPSFVIEQ